MSSINKISNWWVLPGTVYYLLAALLEFFHGRGWVRGLSFDVEEMILCLYSCAVGFMLLALIGLLCLGVFRVFDWLDGRRRS